MQPASLASFRLYVPPDRPKEQSSCIFRRTQSRASRNTVSSTHHPRAYSTQFAADLADNIADLHIVHRKHPAVALQGVLADVSIATGYVTIALMLTGRFVFQYLGWRVAALATPVIMFLSGSAFFGLSISARLGGSKLASGEFNLAAAGALAGAVTQVQFFIRAGLSAYHKRLVRADFWSRL